MTPLRAAVIGLGFIGVQHVEALRRVPQAQVTALCASKEETVQRAGEAWGVEKRYTDWREAVADPQIDVIHNCTPNALHDQINRAAILAGKHIYSEKPLSQSAAEARAIWQLALERGVAHGLNHQYRLNAAVQEMRARVKNGAAGRPLMAYGRYLQESAVKRTDFSPNMNAGPARALSDIGIHWVDTASCVMGQPIAEVMAHLAVHYPTRLDAQGGEHAIGTEDTGMILMRFADGTPGHLITSQAAAGHKNDLRLNVSCEQYEMEWRQETPDTLLVGLQGTGTQLAYMDPRTCQPGVEPWITAPMGHVMGWPDALRSAVRAYYQSIFDGSYKTGEVPYATFKDGFAGMAFVEACLASHKERRWVKVQQP